MSISPGLGLPLSCLVSLLEREDPSCKDLGMVFEVNLEDDPVMGLIKNDLEAAGDVVLTGLGKRKVRVVGIPDFASQNEMTGVLWALGIEFPNTEYKRFVTEFFCPQPSNAQGHNAEILKKNQQALISYFCLNSEAREQLFEKGIKVYERIKNQGERYCFQELHFLGLSYAEKTLQDFLSRCSPQQCKNEKEKIYFFITMLELLIQSCRFKAGTDIPCKQSCFQTMFEYRRHLQDARATVRTSLIQRHEQVVSNTKSADEQNKPVISEEVFFEGIFPFPLADEINSHDTSISAQALIALMVEFETGENENGSIDLLEITKKNWKLGNYAAFKRNAQGSLSADKVVQIAAHVESSIRDKMPALYFLSLNAFMGNENVIEFLRKKGHSVVHVIPKILKNDPSYFRLIETELQFIAKEVQEGSFGAPARESHTLNIRCYPGERIREVFNFEEDGFEFCNLSKETDLLHAFSQYDVEPSAQGLPIVFLEKSLESKSLQVFDQVRKFLGSWGKKSGIQGAFVPIHLIYRNNDPNVAATKPFFLAHADFPKDFLENPTSVVKELWMRATKHVLGEISQADFDKYKRHTWVNFWVPLHTAPTDNTLAIAATRNLRQKMKRFAELGGAPNLGLPYDPEQTWVVQENMMFGSGIVFKTDQVAHSAVNIKVEANEKPHRKSLEFRGMWLS